MIIHKQTYGLIYGQSYDEICLNLILKQKKMVLLLIYVNTKITKIVTATANQFG